MNDIAHRRGIWMRNDSDENNCKLPTVVELQREPHPHDEVETTTGSFCYDRTETILAESSIPHKASRPRLSTVVELCGGREGDDAYVRLAVGEVITQEKLLELRDVLDYGAWMVNEYYDPEPDDEQVASAAW